MFRWQKRISRMKICWRNECLLKMKTIHLILLLFWAEPNIFCHSCFKWFRCQEIEQNYPLENIHHKQKNKKGSIKHANVFWQRLGCNCELTGRSCVWLLLQRQNLSYFNDWIMLVWIDLKHRISKAISLKLIIVMTDLLTSTHKSRAIDALLSFISWCGSRWWNFRLKLKKSEFDSSCKKLIWVIMSAITKSAY